MTAGSPLSGLEGSRACSFFMGMDLFPKAASVFGKHAHASFGAAKPAVSVAGHEAVDGVSEKTWDEAEQRG